MSRSTSDIVRDLRGPRIKLDSETEAAIAALAVVAEDAMAPPSARVAARRGLREMHQAAIGGGAAVTGGRD